MKLNYVVLSAGLAISAACSGDSALSPTPIPAPVQTSQVSVADNVFSPINAQVSAGTNVMWTWRGQIRHDVVFEDGMGSSSLQTSGTHARTFATAGTYRYRCTLHSNGFTNGMIGQVVVQ